MDIQFIEDYRVDNIVTSGRYSGQDEIRYTAYIDGKPHCKFYVELFRDCNECKEYSYAYVSYYKCSECEGKGEVIPSLKKFCKMLFEKEIPVIHLNISYDGGYTEEELYDMLQNAQNEEEREHVKHLYSLHNNRQKGLHIVSECGFRQMNLEKFSLYNENALDLYKKSIEYYYNNDQEWFNYLVNSFISFEDKYNKNYYQEYLKSPEYVRVRLPKFGEDTLD